MTFESLQEENTRLNQANTALLSDIETLTSKLQSSHAEQERLKFLVKKLQHKIWGKSSERRVDDGPEQGLLFSLAEQAKPEEKEIPIQEHSRKIRAKKENKDEEAQEGTFPEYLPRDEDEVIDIKPEGVAEEDLEFFKDVVTERLTSTPEQHRVRRIVRRIYKQKSTGKVLATPPAPGHVLDHRCKVDETFIVLMIIKKFLWHLPLFRQQQELALQGIRLSRDSMVRWTIEFAKLLHPIVEALAILIRGAPEVHCDETPMVVGKPGSDGKKHYKDGYLWPILAPGLGVAFFYTPTRAWKYAEEILKDFEGVLISDAWDGYQDFVEKTNCLWQLCWMHIRRNFVESEASNPQLAKEALAYIRRLYKIETELEDSSPEERTVGRIKLSKPVLDEFHKWLIEKAALPQVITDEHLSQAVSFVLKRWEAACLFVYDGAIPIDNGAAERAIRPGKLGMKNFLHCSSEAGAAAVATFYSLIGSALMHGIHPYYYLLDLCKRLDDPTLSAQDLVPHRWKERFFAEAVPEHLRSLHPTGSPFVGDPGKWRRSLAEA